MSISRRILLAALLASSAPHAAAFAQAQEPASNTVGPPVLRDFVLPGSRTTPPRDAAPTPSPTPAPTPAPSPARPAPAPQAQPPAARTAPPPAAAPAPAADLPESVPLPTPEEIEAEIAARENAEALADEISQIPQADAALPPAPAPGIDVPTLPPVVADAPEEGQGAIPWLYLALGGAALPGIAGFLWWRRREGPEERSGEEILLVRTAGEAPEPFVPPVRPARETALPAAEPAAAPEAAAPAVAAAAPEAPRPWLELEFRPGRAAATESHASIDYELMVKNVGGAPARGIRIEARMFSAGREQEKEIDAFFRAPDPSRATAAPRPLPPGASVAFRNAVALPKEEVREVVLEGRRLFVPMVAFNVLYELGDGQTGQTSMSYLVGRESEPPAEKMGPFRLDLGPRIWRSIGFRPARTALTV
jgi:hypothetical protein